MISDLKFVYYGTSEFSAVILSGLLQAGFKPSLVVSTEPKPAGRSLKLVPTPVSALAQEKNLPLLEVKTLRSPEVQERLTSGQEPVAILAAFGKILPKSVLDLYPKGIVNVHPSLLPLYRGPAPIQYALRDGARETGVSLVILDEEVDHGPVLAQEKCDITATDDTPTLSKKLVEMSVKLLLSTLSSYLLGSLSTTPQDHTRATFTKMIRREDGKADFTKSATELDRQRRAFIPWPGLWTIWQGKRLKFIDTAVLSDYAGQPGRVELKDSRLVIGCGMGGLVIHSLQLEGSKPLSSDEFLRGYPKFVGANLII
ncbi:MAG: methionyl-tRNA formyltransferase [Candidatus Kerfeldbacteria bacterium]|nr:methionyl-tRNA formyltransferase [Candidatus Kerfeldbacteria bacterium]